MAEGTYVEWVHGSTMQVEYLSRITSVRHTGPFVRIEGAGGQNTWVHFPIPTLAVSNGKATRAQAALVSFRTRSHATVHEVIVYDGEKRIAEHMAVDMQGDNLDARFEIPDSPEVQKGLNITVGVTFAEGAPDTRAMQIEIVGVGVEFSGQ